MGWIDESLTRLAVENPHREAVWSRPERSRLSFGELAERVAERARDLGSLDGRSVALAIGNSIAFIELFFALRRSGARVLLIDGGVDHDEKLAICRRLTIDTLLCSGQANCKASVEARPGQGAIVSPAVLERTLAGGIHLFRLAIESTVEMPPETAVIKLTSGSTGHPVGVCFDDASLHAGIEQIAAGMDLGQRDRVMIVVPLSHSYGFDNGILSLAVLGTPLVLEKSIYPTTLLKTILKGEITCLPLVPPLVRGLGQVSWPEVPGLRRVISAGGPLAACTAQCFLAAAGTPVHNFYGSTETGGICFESAPEEPYAAETVGHPLPGVDIRLGADGRVAVRSPANRIGFLCAHEEGARSVLPGSGQTDALVHTGDSAEWTPCGRLRLTGRRADMLNIGGRKVAAARLEEALRQLEGVDEAAVVGIEDEARGDRVIAFVVARCWPLAICGLPAGLKPRALRRVERLPYNQRGKVARARLRCLALGEQQA